MHYTTRGTYSFTSHPKNDAIMVKCLAHGHERRQAGIRTYILTTPELESNALDRSATTLHIRNVCIGMSSYNNTDKDIDLNYNIKSNKWTVLQNKTEQETWNKPKTNNKNK